MTRRIFAVTIFLGALLLFSVQPMIGKYILPWFGGSTAVWITCMLFFQVMLLAGYAYAHANIRLFGPRWGAIVHLVLLALAVAVLPIIPSASWRPSDATYPGLRILLVLLVSVGLPYFVLASTSPLLQAWFGRVQPGKNPYRLYSLSNAGSLLALVIYPFALEPYLGRTSQAWIWSICMILYGVSCAACVVAAWKPKPADASSDGVAGLVVEAEARQEPASQAPAQATLGARLLWLLLPAVAVILLLAVTNALTQEMGALPFLWLLPLGLYLVTFIICFDHQRWYDRRAFIPLLLASILLLVLFIPWKEAVLWQTLFTYLGTMFLACMACHGEVYRLKPDPRHLTGFYLLIAAGGALGGAFVALVAPVIFTGYFELQVGMLACVLLVLVALLRDPKLARYRLTLGILTLASVVLLAPLLWSSLDSGNEHVLKARRNFYGVLRIMTKNTPDRPGERMQLMVHGRTMHGLQYFGGKRDLVPTIYYAYKSGIGLTLDAMTQRNRRIGVIGLGIGTLSAYCRPGDTIRFYEIDPQVIELAQSDFTFLKNCQGKVEIIPGDARVSMEREKDQRYDVLVLDAYSGDTVPAHLLTKEAFEVYRRHLRKGGVLAAHISNRFYSLQCVVEPVAQSVGLSVRYVGNPSLSSLWVLMCEDEKFFYNPALAEAIGTVDFPVATQLWTDEKSNLLSVMIPGAWGR